MDLLGRTGRCTLVLLLMSLSIIAATPDKAYSEAGPSATVNIIMKAWQRRQERLRSVRLEWDTRETLTEGALMPKEVAQGYTVNGVPVEGSIPPREAVYSYPSSLICDGQRLRYTSQAKGWSHKQRDFVPQSHISIFDGTVSKSYSSP